MWFSTINRNFFETVGKTAYSTVASLGVLSDVIVLFCADTEY